MGIAGGWIANSGRAGRQAAAADARRTWASGPDRRGTAPMPF